MNDYLSHAAAATVVAAAAAIAAAAAPWPGGTSWQALAVVDGGGLTPVPKGTEPAMMLGALGTNGLTAYFGLLEIGAAVAQWPAC